MKIDESNCQLMEVQDGYAIKVLIPDGSGNYIHSESTRLHIAVEIRNRLIEFGRIDKIHTSIEKDDTYFRIKIDMVMYEKHPITKEQEQKKVDYHLHFHGRKLNLIDVVHEYDLISEERIFVKP